MTAHENNQLATVNKKIDRILGYLESDPATKSKGLVEKMQNLEEKVSKIQTDEKVKNAKLAGLTMAGSAAISVLIWMLKEFII
jgi:hypothetical protein